MIKMYGFWRSLASFRVRIALNMKGVAYEEPVIDLLKGDQHGAEYKKVNPQGVIPSLDMGDGGNVLFQSLAILEYLDETYPTPPLMPATPRARARVRGLALIAAADTHPLVVPRIRNYLETELKLDEPTRVAFIRRWIDEGSAAIETHLARESETGRFCHGDSPTIADICIASHWVGAKLFAADQNSFPTLAKVMGNCFALEPFARAHPLKQPGAPTSH